MELIDPLKNIVYISLPEKFNGFKDLPINPAILLPVEIDPENGLSDITNLSWEMMIAAMLKILAHNPNHEDTDYFRTLIMTIRPDVVTEMTNAAIVKASEKEFDIAEEIFLSLKNLQPEAFNAMLNLALLYEERADSYTALGREDFSEHYNEQAFCAYKELLSRNDESADAHFNFGLFYLKRGNFDKAATHLELFINKSTDGKKIKKVKEILTQLNTKKDSDELFLSAYDSIKLGREEEAIEKIKKYLATESEVWNAWFLLGWAYRRKKMYTEGAEAFKKALSLGSDQIDLFNELAICLMEIGKLDESREYLLIALKAEPENIKILSNLGLVSLKNNKPAAAEEYFKSVLTIAPDDKIAAGYLSRL